MEISPYTILIVLSFIVIISYIFNILAKALKVPSVLMLIGTGIALKYILENQGIAFKLDPGTLELLGIMGLILIVLEASLDLKLTREKLPIIRKSFGSALVLLLLTTVAISYIFHYFLGASLHASLVNAVPLGIISSAIAIPSVRNLDEHKREFIVYESSLSDILGIVLFNYVIQREILTAGSFATLGLNLLLIIIISVVSSFLLLFLMKRIKFHIKFFLIIAILILIYSLGKNMHLSSLVLIMTFGLIINNTGLIFRGRLEKYINKEALKEELQRFKSITRESAFIIRTFFFLLFGYYLDINTVLDLTVVTIGVSVLISIYILRFLYLKLIIRSDMIPELYIAPRGLITILLFFTIPKEYAVDAGGSVATGILFFVIILTSLMMLVGLLSEKQRAVSIRELIE